jgi:hypothetical protein
MHSSDIANFFHGATQAESHPKVGPRDNVATIFGFDEFKADAKAGTLDIPGVGLVSAPELGDGVGHDWLAVVADDTGAMQFAFGNGNPFEARPDNFLPTKGGHVLALPYVLAAAGARRHAGQFRPDGTRMNRSERRAAEKAQKANKKSLH